MNVGVWVDLEVLLVSRTERWAVMDQAYHAASMTFPQCIFCSLSISVVPCTGRTRSCWCSFTGLAMLYIVRTESIPQVAEHDRHQPGKTRFHTRATRIKTWLGWVATGGGAIGQLGSSLQLLHRLAALA